MRATLWLAFRELISRKYSFVIAVLALSVGVALCVATEIVSQAREVAVFAEMDQMGPAIKLLPISDNSKTTYFGKATISDLSKSLSRTVRAIEPRLTFTNDKLFVVGIDPDNVVLNSDILKQINNDNIVIGSQVAREFNSTIGDSYSLWEDDFRINNILPSTASTDDLSVFVPLEYLQQILDVENKFSELRLYLLPGIDANNIKEKILSSYSNIRVIIPDRDDAVRTDMNQGLQQHRWIVYTITAFIASLCILVWAHFNADERRLEIATLAAIGSTSSDITTLLGVRAICVGLLGGLIGYIIGAIYALFQDYSSASVVIYSWSLSGIFITGTALLSLIGTLPISIISALREQVIVLQE